MVLDWWEHLSYIIFTSLLLRHKKGQMKNELVASIAFFFFFYITFIHFTQKSIFPTSLLSHLRRHAGNIAARLGQNIFSGLTHTQQVRGGGGGVQEGLVREFRNAYDSYVCRCVFWQQGWCLSRHVRRWRLLLWHLHCHLIGGQDVLEKRKKHDDSLGQCAGTTPTK